jgi:hypothetical protein
VILIAVSAIKSCRYADFDAGVGRIVLALRSFEPVLIYERVSTDSSLNLNVED